MHCEPAVRDGGLYGRAIFLVAAASIPKLRVDDGNRQATGVIGFDRVRQLKQFALGGLGRREGRSSLNFTILAPYRTWRAPRHRAWTYRLDRRVAIADRSS
jgi:hypothetical protein